MPKLPVPSSFSFDRRLHAHVRRLFERYDLDPDDLHDWRKLLFKLAGDPPGRWGRWHSGTLCMLRHHVEVLGELIPGKTDEWYCEQISQNKGKYALSEPHFKGIKPGTLRRKLADARKPAMRAIYETYCEGIRRYAKEV
jgi:hypothetical protein